jgi:hypothetical protein
MKTSHTTPALSLSEVHLTLRPEPLSTEAELAAFYREEINYVRGDQIQRLAQGLKRAYGSNHFKALLMGHQGVGKSTELSCLSLQLAEQFRMIRFSAVHDLDPSRFQPLDIILTMMAEVAERTSQPIEDGGAGQVPAEVRLQEIWDWFATEKETREQAVAKVVTIKIGAIAREDSLWLPILGLFANLKNEMKFATNRKQSRVESRIERLPALLEIANRLFDNCNDLLHLATGQEWLFIGEDFDNTGILPTLIENSFIKHAHIFRELRGHLIFTLPISLYYSSKAQQLPFTSDRCFVLAETPMFYPDRRPNMKGQWAIADVLTARMLSSLFDADQMERLIVASGGNLCDLFSLVNYAADTAELRGATTISRDDAHEAIVHLRNNYEQRLGQSPYDVEKVTYQEKSDRLLKIYDGDQSAHIPDEITYSLLRSRALQQFSGEHCFGIHPLTVDILAKQGLIEQSAIGAVPGGAGGS